MHTLTHTDAFTQQLEKPFTPPGDKVHEYITPSNAKYEIFLVTPENSSQFAICADTMQTFGLFFIDGASIIDSEDPRWMLFQVLSLLSRAPLLAFLTPAAVIRRTLTTTITLLDSPLCTSSLDIPIVYVTA